MAVFDEVEGGAVEDEEGEEGGGHDGWVVVMLVRQGWG